MTGGYGREKRIDRRKNGLLLFLIALCGLFYIAVSSLVQAGYQALRDDYLEKLAQERQIAETNGRLRTELAALTQSRYLALRAKERLGMKKPAEEEVLVVR